MIDCAFNQNVQWENDGLIPTRLSINISARHFEKEDLINFIRTKANTTGIDMELIELELTESSLMTSPEEAIKILHKLKSMGISIAIDDFGTGYSSFSYLKRLPIDRVKIDQSFVRDIKTDQDGRTIIKAMVAMLQNMNLAVVAEGVESQEEMAFLLEHGCNEAQGYYYDRPMPADDFGKLLEKRQ